MKFIHYTDLDEVLLCSKFPELSDSILNENNYLGELLPHCLYGNILNPLTTTLLKEQDYKTNALLNRIFDFYEELAEYGDQETCNLLQVTLLEYLWDEYVVYNRAIETMGYHTKLINDYIGDYLYKPTKQD